MPMGINIFSIIVYIFYIIVFVLGLVNAVAPKWCWRTFESWKAVKEPSKAYFIVKRISGIVIMIFIAAAALTPALIYYLS